MSQPRTGSGQIANVRALAGLLGASKTTAILKAEQMEVVRIVILAGKGLPFHEAPGEITVQCIEGCIDFATHSEVHRMAAGDLIHLRPREPHALHAIEDSSALLTMCLRPN
jgi:quercetin dioxygenase-like cupin family protein